MPDGNGQFSCRYDLIEQLKMVLANYSKIIIFIVQIGMIRNGTIRLKSYQKKDVLRHFEKLFLPEILRRMN
jgi:hypothetical protein